MAQPLSPFLTIPILEDYAVTPTSPYSPMPTPWTGFSKRFSAKTNEELKHIQTFHGELAQGMLSLPKKIYQELLVRKWNLMTLIVVVPGLWIVAETVCGVVVKSLGDLVCRILGFFLSQLPDPEPIQELPKDLKKLQLLAPEGLDVRHLRTGRKDIDVSGVPSTVQVGSLLAVFDEINFDDPGKPGYWAGALQGLDAAGLQAVSLQKDDFRDQLGTFIHNVEHRVVRTGTPKQEEPQALEEFYLRIENIVRLCLHQSDEEIAQFKKKVRNEMEKRGETWDESQWVMQLQPGDRAAYDSLLKQRARLAIDFGAGAGYCGGRYTDVANDFLFFLGEEDARLPILEETLIEFLASERAKSLHMVGHELSPGVAHGSSGVMRKIGELVRAAQIKGAIDLLAPKLDETTVLCKFFARYNPETILEKIQEKLQSSEAFREQVVDWVRSQVFEWVEKNGWKKDVYNQSELILGVLDTVGQVAAEKAEPSDSHLELLEIVWDCRAEINGPLKSGKSWEDALIEACFCQPWVTERMRKLGGGDRIKVVQAKQFLKTGLDHFEIQTCLSDQNWEEIRELLEAHQKEKRKSALLKQIEIEEIGAPFSHMSEERLKELLSGKTTASRKEMLVREGLEFARKRFFFDLVMKSHFSETFKASPEILEWLLVSHGIFTPQQRVGP